MALRAAISEEEYLGIFGSSDDELDANGSDIDFEGFEVDSDEENDSEGEETTSETSDVEAETETPWTVELSNFEVCEFSGEPGLRVNFEDGAKADDYFLRVFGEETIERIVEETNRYARQNLQNNARRLAVWKDVSQPELKAYFGVCVIMGINQLPKVADYWKDDPYVGNSGIKGNMTRNRFQEISQFLHFADSMRTPAQGEEG